MPRPPFVPIVWGAADQLLGTMSDRELARHLDVDANTVQRRRQLLGIAPWRQQRRILKITCVICGKQTPVVGRRASRLRVTCPSWFPGRISRCQKKLIKQTLLKTMGKYKPVSPRNLIKRVGGSSVVRLLD